MTLHYIYYNWFIFISLSLIFNFFRPLMKRTRLHISETEIYLSVAEWYKVMLVIDELMCPSIDFTQWKLKTWNDVIFDRIAPYIDLWCSSCNSNPVFLLLILIVGDCGVVVMVGTNFLAQERMQIILSLQCYTNFLDMGGKSLASLHHVIGFVEHDTVPVAACSGSREPMTAFAIK